jgi:hypothetical protein
MQSLWIALCSYALVLSSAAPAFAQDSPATERLPRLRDPSATDSRAAARIAAARIGALPAGAVKVPSRAPALAPSPGATANVIRMPLSLEGQSAQGLDTDTIRITSGAGAISRAPSGAAMLELRGEGQVIVSSESGKNSAGDSEISVERKTALPWLVIETRRGARGTTVHTARPFLTLAKAILWNAAEQRHVAEFLFGLDSESGEPGPLAQPIDARFTVSCDDVLPSAARIAHVGPAGYGTVRVGCSRSVKNERAQQQLEIHVDRGNLSYPFQIPRRPGPLSLTGSSRVLGFGLGNLVLTVSRVEEDGSAMSSGAQLPVQLVVEQGRLDVHGLTIPRGAHEASVEAHPPGIGRIAVRAVASAQQSPPLAIELTWPVLPVSAMIAGGTLGGFLSALRRAPRVRRRRTLEGALVGLLITLVVLVVPSFATLPAAARETELGLFVLSALAGYIGTQLLDRAARALFPTLAQDPQA